MQAYPWLAFCLLSLTAFSGCAGDAMPQTTAQTSVASPALASADAGAIKGTVTDDTLAPLPDVEIAILKGDASTRSDAAGSFSFSELVPGEIQIVAQKVGYQQWGKKLTVAAGEVAEVRIVLVSIVIETPYPEVLPFVGIIHLGEAFLDIVTSTYAPQLCEKCRWNFNTTADTVSLVTEIKFTPSVTSPLGNQLYFALYKASGGSTLGNGFWETGSKRQVDRNWAEKGEPMYQLNTCDAEWVCYEQKFYGYITLFHGAKPDEDYTALPTE